MSVFHSLLFASALALSSSVFAQQFKLAELTVENPWSRSTATQAKMGVVYFSVKNAGAADILLGVAVDQTIAQAASIHEMTMDDKGMMRMRELAQGIEIAAKSQLNFSPGGYHIMLEGLTKPLLAKQSFKLTLYFAKAGALQVAVNVQERAR
jgi:periplasmic copper chaperone A